MVGDPLRHELYGEILLVGASDISPYSSCRRGSPTMRSLCSSCSSLSWFSFRVVPSLSPLEELQDHQIHQLQKEEQLKQKAQQDQNGCLLVGASDISPYSSCRRGSPTMRSLCSSCSSLSYPEQVHELQGNLKQQILAPQLSIRSRKPVVSDLTLHGPRPHCGEDARISRRRLRRRCCAVHGSPRLGISKTTRNKCTNYKAISNSKF
jgi:hypothetical protein